MSKSTKPVRTTTATCACGASFEREIKRGRPQVWCPACIEVPFYERTKAAVPVTETGEAVVVVAKPVNENDPLGQVRELVEAEVAQVNAEHKAIFAAKVAAGADKHAAAVECGVTLHEALIAVYAQFRLPRRNSSARFDVV